MKKILTISIIIILVLGTVFYFSNKKTTTNPDGTKSGFKSFFNFGSRNTPESPSPEGETSSEFTPENPETIEGGAENGGTNTGASSVFGTNGPFTPTTNGGIAGSGNINGGGSIGGSTIGGGGEVTGGGGVGSGTGGTGSGSTGGGGTGGGTGTLSCSEDDIGVEFTPEEIARLRALEDRFYAIAPTLRTDNDVQAESANYSSYKLLNQKYIELTTYCENKSPLLPSNINRRVSTPFYTDASASAYFSDGPDADGVIDLQSTSPKLKEIESFFRINIW